VGGQIVSMIVTNRPVGLLRQGYGGQDARACTAATTVNLEMARMRSSPILPIATPADMRSARDAVNPPLHPAAAGCQRAVLLALATLGLVACSRPTTQTEPASAPVSSPPAAPGSASFKFAGQTLTVPAGFTVELVAGPPLVNRPISIAFDNQGRLYATDSSGLSDRAPRQFEEKPHRVVRLEDADGDGRFEKSVVFAEKMMFPQGALFHDGSLYVAAPPHIWKLTDTNGDGWADVRTAWWDGKTLTGCANDVHGPYLGPDGWFYWTKGAFAEQRHTLGNGKAFVTRAAHIYRSRADGTGFEPVLTGGMDNPVGVTFSSTGDRFLNGTFFQIPAAGRRDGLIHAIHGGVYGKENAASAGHPRTGDLMPIMTHMGAAAPCGSIAYRSQVFGAGYADNLFVCYFNLHKIVRHELVAHVRPTCSRMPTAACSSSTPAAGTKSVARRRSWPSPTCSAASSVSARRVRPRSPTRAA
jgi:putative membrane-bound dehydrogenase-like protein